MRSVVIASLDLPSVINRDSFRIDVIIRDKRSVARVTGATHKGKSSAIKFRIYLTIKLFLDRELHLAPLRRDNPNGISFRRFYGYWPVHEVDPRAAKYFDPQLPPDAGRDTLRRRLLRLVRPFGARRRVIAAIHLEAHPEQVYPQWISREGDYFLVDSEIVNFSEQPLLVSKALYLSLSDWCRAHPRHRRINGAPVMEHALNSRWWRGRHFKVGFCDEGVFTHNRFDDSWRPEHAAFNAAISEEKR